jgi:DhnA family fructose-bisphosphate aldolase class Ia
MNISKKIRLNRIFSHPGGRLCSVAVDHFIGSGKWTSGDGLSNLPAAFRGCGPVTAALKSLKAVILDGFSPEKDLAANGLSGLE